MERATLTTPSIETWVPVHGFEGLYEVSDLGRVRSLDRLQSRSSWRQREFMQHYKGRILKPHYNNMGYATVDLQIHKKVDRRLISRMVAEAFIPNPDNLPCVNHKDQNPANNRVDNLEWCTVQYNVTYANAIELRTIQYSKPVEQLTLEGKHVAFFKSSADAERQSNGYFDQVHIRHVCIGYKKCKTHKGYLWRYVE